MTNVLARVKITGSSERPVPGAKPLYCKSCACESGMVRVERSADNDSGGVDPRPKAVGNADTCPGTRVDTPLLGENSVCENSKARRNFASQENLLDQWCFLVDTKAT